MGMSVKVELTGFKELQTMLKTIEPRAAKKIASATVREGMKTVLAAAKSKCPVSTGALRKALKVRRTPKAKRGTIAFSVTTNPSGKTMSQGDYYYAWDVEFGSAHAPAYPFLRPAFDESIPSVLSAMRDKLRTGLDNYFQGGK